MTTDEIRAHRALLEKLAADINEKLDDFGELRKQDRKEYEARAHRYRVGMTLMGIIVVLLGVLGACTYSIADNVKDFQQCQATINKRRAQAAEEYSTNTLAYSEIRLDPTSTPEEIDEARQRYYGALRRQIQTQRANPLSNCEPPN